MDIYEITGYATGVNLSGVNYLQPADSFQNIQNGFINRQVLQSRKGVGYFAPRLSGNTRVMGIFEHTLPGGTKELLAFDTIRMYKYNAITGVFDPIAFGMAAYTTFGISSNDFYISGVSYPTFDNKGRFVFCGSGITPNAAGSSIFFYDNTSNTVLDYTSVVDNPKYQAPIDPAGAGGALIKAELVQWFGARLNFIIPTIGSTVYNQGILFSALKDSAGNGDKFASPGAGLLQPDTYQNITGAQILGDVMVVNFERSNYVIEKTSDAYNPFFHRRIPGPIGTNAKFSSVAWAENEISLGKTGIISSDGRVTNRIDDKIPNFTKTVISQNNFNLTYGGFDRVNNQFLWSYLLDESEDTSQNYVLAYNYTEGSWSVYDQRFSVLGQTDIGLSYNWEDIDETTGNASWARWDTTEDIWDEIGLGAGVQKTLAGDNLGFIYDINVDYDDYVTDISNVTTGTTTTLTVAEAGILPGDYVTIENVEGMTELNTFDPETDEQIQDNYLVLTGSTATSLIIEVDSRNFSAYTLNTGKVSKIIAFSAETIPINPYRKIGRRCYMSHVEFLIDNNGGSLLVDVYADEEESPFIQNVKIIPTDTQQSRQWITMSVNQEADFLSFVLKQESASVQLRLTSMRMYMSQGGLTSG